jgi:hypothetical protein
MLFLVASHKLYHKHTFSKIFEKVIYQRLFDHLNNNAILNEHQYGFRSNMSTESATFVLLNEILTALNNK